VSGLARVFEATVSYELLANGTIIARGFTTASIGAPEWGEFDFEVSYPTPTANTPAILRVYEVSMKDGSPMNVVEVALILEGSGSAAATPASAPTLTSSTGRRLLVYFAKEDSSQTTYVAVTRPWPDTPEVGRASLEALIQGPNAAERALGLSSPIPAGTRLIDLRIESKVAYANGSRDLDPGGGSARVSAIHQVIDRTLRQFSTIERVVVQIEGSSSGILQP